MSQQVPESKTSARDWLVDTAYGRFTDKGFHRVGIDDIVREAGCAKVSLYYHLAGKEDLALAVLYKREEVCTRGWLELEIMLRADKSHDRLFAIFDIFDEWFHKDRFEGCTLINALLETAPDDPLHISATNHLAKVRAIIYSLARDCGLKNADEFAQSWHMLMKGSIVSAGESNRDAARSAKKAAQLVLKHWPNK